VPEGKKCPVEIRKVTDVTRIGELKIADRAWQQKKGRLDDYTDAGSLRGEMNALPNILMDGKEHLFKREQKPKSWGG